MPLALLYIEKYYSLFFQILGLGKAIWDFKAPPPGPLRPYLKKSLPKPNITTNCAQQDIGR